MTRNVARDLTTGSIPRHVLALAWPAVLASLIHNFYGINDVFFAKETGLAGQAAISNNLFALIAIFGITQLAAIGTMTLVSRRSGAGNEAGVNEAARQGMFLAVALALVTSIAGLVLAPLLPRLMRMAPDVSIESLTYLRIIFLGLPAIFFFPTVESIFRARGDTRTPVILHVTAVVTNALGNAVAVWVLDAGVAGIAVATIISRIAGGGLGLYFILRGRIGIDLSRPHGPRYDFRVWRRIATVSAPLAARTALFGFIYLIVSGITAEFGTEAQNGLGVGIRAEGLCFFILLGFAMAAGPIVGQNLGAGKPDRAARGAWTTVAIAMVPSVAFTILYLAIPRTLMTMLASDVGTIDHGIDYLRIVAACFVFLNLEVVLAHSFIGAGDTMPPMLIDVPLTALRIPAAWFLAVHLGWGPIGVWWAISGTAILRGIGMTLWFLRGNWKRARPDLDY